MGHHRPGTNVLAIETRQHAEADLLHQFPGTCAVFGHWKLLLSDCMRFAEECWALWTGSAAEGDPIWRLLRGAEADGERYKEQDFNRLLQDCELGYLLLHCGLGASACLRLCRPCLLRRALGRRRGAGPSGGSAQP